MLAAKVIVIIGVGLFLALGKAAGKDKYKDTLNKEFDGYKYCEDDCYECDYQGICKKSAMREL